MDPLLVLLVLGVIALAELPDKSLFASLVLGTRFPARWVFLGVAAAFAVHVVLAVAAGGLLSLLPRRLVEAVVAVLFLLGALLILREDLTDEAPDEVTGELDDVAATVAEAADPAATDAAGGQARRAVLTSFGVVFIGEWGDLTQIATANYAAKYGDPLSVGLGAVLGLWIVAGLAVTVGGRVFEVLPVRPVRRTLVAVLLVFAVVSAVAAVRG